MGFTKNAKISHADKDAIRALEEGRTIYVHRFPMPNLNSGVSRSVSGAAEVIETIETAGWHLEHTTFEDRGQGSLILIFRPSQRG